MEGEASVDPGTRITHAVWALLESDGYDALQLRDVARVARVSMSTIYQRYPNRDELVLAAITEWVDAHIYRELAPPHPEETLAEGLIRMLRYVFEPWEHNPHMLEPYFRARSIPGGHRLDAKGFEAVLPVAAQIFAGIQPDYAADLGLVLTNMTYALVGRCAAGDLDSAEILPAMERIIMRMTGDNVSLTTPVAEAANDHIEDFPAFGIGPSFHSPFAP
ncbi:TetR family transcriptional regulator [Nocardia noduli]|uniref:TetR family transcriptional regulator n=1 Tax=Nocardia noduli TaxID=2815722 RepID=UPI0020B34A4A|nr:TetR family transcriptional regulator [Nocardia noduli]